LSGSVKPLDMRYDGAPRRSQKENQNIVDRIWSFFSSVRVGVWLIILTLLGVILGSIFPQESAFLKPPTIDYYEQNYGVLGTFYFTLGLSHTYESWWFKLLVVMLGSSIVIASLDRGIPLYKILKNQRPERSVDFLSRQKITLSVLLPQTSEEKTSSSQRMIRIEKALQELKYNTRSSGNAILAEKHRWSRWGPYVNHVGLIIVLLIILIRTMPGFMMEQYVSILEGDTKPIKSTNYYVKNEKFTVEFYDDVESRTIPRFYETNAILYECIERCGTSNPSLEEVFRGNILVNEPLTYRGISLYQFGYDVTPQIREITVELKNKQSGKPYGQFRLKTTDPDLSYNAGPYKLRLHNYYPEFALDEQGEPTSLSAQTPKAPGYIFNITGPNLPVEGISYMYFPREIDKVRFGQDRINQLVGSGNQFVIEADGMENVKISNYTSTLAVRSDPTAPYLLVGGSICMLGLIMGFYWQHRRIWARFDGDRITFAAHTNKNWYGLKKEFEKFIKKSEMPMSSIDASQKQGVNS
jgi:cytochrome c biogenesis protein